MPGQPLRRARKRADKANQQAERITDGLTDSLLLSIDTLKEVVQSADPDPKLISALSTGIGILFDRRMIRKKGDEAPEDYSEQMQEALHAAIPDAAARKAVALRILNGTEPEASTG